MSSNSLSNIPTCLSIDSLTHLDLSSNGFTTIEHIRQLTYLRRLQDLRLRSNPLTSLSSPPNRPIIFATLIRLDLTSTLLPTFSSLNPIIQSFPVLASLLTNHTPLTAFPSASLYTIARLATLTELNFTRITPAERQNAELYYLNQITAQLAAANDPNEKTAVLEEHPRWKKLCDIYGEPETAKKQGPDNVDGGSLAARVTEFNFYISRQDLHKARAQAKAVDGHEDEEARDVDDEDVDSNNAHSPPGSSIVEGKKLLIPLTVDVYRLKGIAGRLFNLRPMSVRLVWETGERDPVGGVGEGEWSVSEDDSSDDEGEGGQGRSKREARMKAEDGTNWVPRETELVDGTRQVGFWIESSEARVRVELR